MSSSSAKRRRRVDFKPKLIALSVAACFGLSNGPSLANPTGGTVSSGSATFASSGNTLTITNSAGAIIKDCGTGALVSTTSDQEIIEVCLSGGAGYGPPAERSPAAIRRDVAEGYVTPEGAARDYGAHLERAADTTVA